MTYIAHFDIKGLAFDGLISDQFRFKFLNMIQETHPANILRIKQVAQRMSANVE